MKELKKFLKRPLITFSGIIAVTMFALSYFGIFGLTYEFPKKFGVLGFGNRPSVGGFFMDLLVQGYIPAILLLIYLIHRTLRYAENFKRIPMRLILIWALIIGIPLGMGTGEGIKYWGQQSKLTQSQQRDQKLVDEARGICQKFRHEEVCVSSQHDVEWARRVSRCITSESSPDTAFLPEECASLGESFPARLVNSTVFTGPLLDPIKPPAQLAKHVREGEELTQMINPQVLTVVSEIWAMDHYPRIEASIVGLGSLFSPPHTTPTNEVLEWSTRNQFRSILKGDTPNAYKNEIEKDFDVKIGLSLKPDQLSEEEKRAVGLLISFYNRSLVLTDEIQQRAKTRAKTECAKYPKGNLRPIRCTALGY